MNSKFQRSHINDSEKTKLPPGETDHKYSTRVAIPRGLEQADLNQNLDWAQLLPSWLGRVIANKKKKKEYYSTNNDETII